MKSLSFLEIKAILSELEKLLYSRVEKIYQLDDEFYFIFYNSKYGKQILRIKLPNYLHLTEFKKQFPAQPKQFCTILRKYLKGAILNEINQLPFERVVVLKFNNAILIVELFSKGNLILCNLDKMIIAPFRMEKWKTRIIKPKEKYVFPPQKISELNFANFEKNIKNSDKEIVKILASDFGLGGTYAEEVCFRANINKNLKGSSLDEESIKSLFENLKAFMTSELHPNVIFENEKIVDVQPFDLEIYEKFQKKYFETFSKAIDYYSINLERQPKKNEEEERIIKSMEKQKEHLVDLKEKAKKYRECGKYIYQHLYELKEILNHILESKKKEEIKNELIKEVKHDKIILNFNNIEIPFSQGPTKVANEFFEKAKKIESKLKKISGKIEELKKKLEKVKAEKREEKITIVKKRKKKWYEKFNYFFTSNGFLAIAGKDANQNEVLIKKYLEENDLVFHAEIIGSPFTILKNGKASKDIDKRETAIFTLCHSKAWKRKLPVPVYFVNKNQVSKKAPSGEYLKKGSFMIYGKKSYITDVELKFSIGLNENFEIFSGPVDTVKNSAKYFVTLVPGNLNKDVLAKKIKENFIEKAKKEDKEKIKSISIEELKEHCIEGSELVGNA